MAKMFLRFLPRADGDTIPLSLRSSLSLYLSLSHPPSLSA